MRPCGEGYTKETYSVATAEGLNIEEGKDLVTLEELEGRDITWAGSVSDILGDGRNRSGGGVEGEMWCSKYSYNIPLIILQKMQAAEDMVVVGRLIPFFVGGGGS